MGLLADWQIIKLCEEQSMIVPFVTDSIKSVDGRGVFSYGPSSYGYDIRVANEYKIFRRPVYSLSEKLARLAKNTLHRFGLSEKFDELIVDPKNMDSRLMQGFIGDVCVIPPNSFALARSIETISMPRNVTAICLGKSSMARCGIILNFTPFEAGWRGQVTIEISNSTPLPVKIYSNEGIAQVLFFEGDQPCVTSYADRKGKYQNQSGITTAKV